MWITLCYNTYRNRVILIILHRCVGAVVMNSTIPLFLESRKVNMVVDDTIAQALNRIADNQEEMNETLKRIANHYDGVVPVMTRNAKRAETLAEEHERTFTQGIKDIFRPQEN
jgi:hypothetical protein